MYLQDKLAALHGRMFTTEMPDILLDAYHMEMELQGFTIPEDDYKKGKAVLEHSLTDEQKDTLRSIEASWEKSMKQAVGLGFLRGLYAGFQKAFAPDVPEDPFQTLVVDELLTMPNMQHHTEYYNERQKALLMSSFLYDQINSFMQIHLTSIESAWDERLYGVLRYAFNVGYKHALSLVDEIQYRKPGDIIRLEV